MLLEGLDPIDLEAPLGGETLRRQHVAGTYALVKKKVITRLSKALAELREQVAGPSPREATACSAEPSPREAT